MYYGRILYKLEILFLQRHFFILDIAWDAFRRSLKTLSCNVGALPSRCVSCKSSSAERRPRSAYFKGVGRKDEVGGCYIGNVAGTIANSPRSSVLAVVFLGASAVQ